MFSSKWDNRFLALAEHISTWSKDPSSKVGAIIVDDNKIVVGMGYNGFPRGVWDKVTRYSDRETKYKFVVHAEVNACLQAGNSAKNATLYVSTLPFICNECAKVIVQYDLSKLQNFESDFVWGLTYCFHFCFLVCFILMLHLVNR